MRLVQVTVPAGMRDAVLSALDDEGVDYVVTDETSGREYVGVVYFPLPTNAVEPVLERLREIGLDDEAYTVVLSAETVVSRKFEQLEAAYDEREDDGERIARQELRARAEDLASTLPTYVVMTVTSAVVATAGLLLDSPATVVGSMVIAPLIGPAMAAAVGTVVDDADLFRRGVAFQVLGIALTIVAAAAFAFGIRAVHLVPPGLDPASIEQVQERLSPDFLSLAVALGSGTAGAVSLMTGISTALVGVMIAVALVPPAATAGIGVAYGDASMVLSSGVLAVVNGLSINLSALVVLWYAGYRPERLFRWQTARAATLRRIAVILAAIAVLSVVLGGVTYDSYQSTRTEQAIEDAIGPMFEEGGRYAGLTLLESTVRTEPSQPLFLFHHVETVAVTVGVPPDARAPGLVDALDDRVDAVVGRDVEVRVRYVEFERSR